MWHKGYPVYLFLHGNYCYENCSSTVYLVSYYADTRDGLPIIGVYDEHPNCYFVYVYGGNGAVCSMALAKCLRDWIGAGQSDNAQLYLPDRPLVSALSS
ncbi:MULTISPECIES: FAD-binding oxidoreductase [Geobacillus]|uniref:FAD-binding oxidoreductase n=1 Tax=Geobacillus TaxID=129337 RepID=UPI0003FC150C|nr:FAD-binding oxidoreductase [Geobacillus genomosp. 3]